MPVQSATLEPTDTGAAELYRRALEHAEDEEYETALELLETARRHSPSHVGLYLAAAQILAADLEQYDAALEMVEQAERLRPGAPTVGCMRAEIDFQRGDFDVAERAYRELVDVPEVEEVASPGLARSLLARARQLVERRRFDVAVGLLLESLEWDESAAAHLNLGICHHGAGRAQPAYKEYSSAVELDPQNPLAYFQMGMLMADCGQVPAAAAAFAQTLTVDPEYPEARHRLAAMQGLLGNFEAVVNIVESELQRHPDCLECRQLLSDANLSLGNQEAALPHLEFAANVSPRDFVAQYSLGALYVAVGRPGDALAPLTRAPAIDPELFAERWRHDERFIELRDRPEFAALQSG